MNNKFFIYFADTKYYCPTNRLAINPGPPANRECHSICTDATTSNCEYNCILFISASVNMCYNCGIDGHKREMCPNPLNPPEVQNVFKKMGVKEKRRQGVIPGFKWGGAEMQKKKEREELQLEGRNIPVSFNLTL